MPDVFPLRLDRPWRWLLRAIGVRPGAADVRLTDQHVVATFGRFLVEARIDNLEGYQLTGPYRTWKAIGPRASAADHGFTFGTSAHGGVCLCFRTWIPFRYVRGRLLESLTVTVDDVDGLAAALERRGVRGQDRRDS